MMTETITRVQLAELKTVRIVCRKDGCAGIIELPLADMMTRNAGLDRCPVCGSDYARYFPPGRHLFVELANLLDKLNSIRAFSLEFTIPSQP